MYHDDNGRFVDGGYIVNDSSDLTEHYHERDDIHDDCCIFAYPEPEKPIAKALATYKQRISEVPSASHERPSPASTERQQNMINKGSRKFYQKFSNKGR